MKICLNQFIRPKESKSSREGVGNCNICTFHKDNEQCKEYYPITITIYEVKEKEQDYAVY